MTRRRRILRWAVDVGIVVLVAAAIAQGLGAVAPHQGETASGIGTLAWLRCVLSTI